MHGGISGEKWDAIRAIWFLIIKRERARNSRCHECKSLWSKIQFSRVEFLHNTRVSSGEIGRAVMVENGI